MNRGQIYRAGNRNVFTVERIGQGIFGVVFLGHFVDDPRTQVVVKEANDRNQEQEAQKFRFEAEVLHQLNGAGGHVPRLLYDGSTAQPPYLVMEQARGERLSELRFGSNRQGTLDEPLALEIVGQLVETLAYAERYGYAYDDWKISDLFWDSAERKLTLIDWNLATTKPDERRQMNIQQVGAILYQLVVGEVSGSGGREDAPGWLAVTRGVQAILRRTHHPTPGNEYHTFDALLGDLDQESQRLQRPAATLLDKAAQDLNGLTAAGRSGSEQENATAAAAIEQAELDLSVLDRRRAALVPDDAARLDRLLQQLQDSRRLYDPVVVHLSRAKRLAGQGSPTAAVKELAEILAHAADDRTRRLALQLILLAQSPELRKPFEQFAKAEPAMWEVTLLDPLAPQRQSWLEQLAQGSALGRFWEAEQRLRQVHERLTQAQQQGDPDAVSTAAHEYEQAHRDWEAQRDALAGVLNPDRWLGQYCAMAPGPITLAEVGAWNKAREDARQELLRAWRALAGGDAGAAVAALRVSIANLLQSKLPEKWRSELLAAASQAMGIAAAVQDKRWYSALLSLSEPETAGATATELWSSERRQCSTNLQQKFEAEIVGASPEQLPQWIEWLETIPDTRNLQRRLQQRITERESQQRQEAERQLRRFEMLLDPARSLLLGPAILAEAEEYLDGQRGYFQGEGKSLAPRADGLLRKVQERQTAASKWRRQFERGHLGDQPLVAWWSVQHARTAAVELYDDPTRILNNLEQEYHAKVLELIRKEAKEYHEKLIHITSANNAPQVMQPFESWATKTEERLTQANFRTLPSEFVSIKDIIFRLRPLLRDVHAGLQVAESHEMSGSPEAVRQSLEHLDRALSACQQIAQLLPDHPAAAANWPRMLRAERGRLMLGAAKRQAEGGDADGALAWLVEFTQRSAANRLAVTAEATPDFWEPLAEALSALQRSAPRPLERRPADGGVALGGGAPDQDATLPPVTLGGGEEQSAHEEHRGYWLILLDECRKALDDAVEAPAGPQSAEYWNAQETEFRSLAERLKVHGHPVPPDLQDKVGDVAEELRGKLETVKQNREIAIRKELGEIDAALRPDPLATDDSEWTKHAARLAELAAFGSTDALVKQNLARAQTTLSELRKKLLNRLFDDIRPSAGANGDAPDPSELAMKFRILLLTEPMIPDQQLWSAGNREGFLSVLKFLDDKKGSDARRLAQVYVRDLQSGFLPRLCQWFRREGEGDRQRRRADLQTWIALNVVFAQWKKQTNTQVQDANRA